MPDRAPPPMVIYDMFSGQPTVLRGPRRVQATDLPAPPPRDPSGLPGWIGRARPYCRISDLPGIAQDVARVIGVDLTLDLCAALGGCVRWWPHEPSDGHPAVLAIGRAAASAACSVLGPAMGNLPMIGSCLVHARRRLIRELRHTHSVAQICAELGMSERRVREALPAAAERGGPDLHQ